jgi:hypothetical protein
MHSQFVQINQVRKPTTINQTEYFPCNLDTAFGQHSQFIGISDLKTLSQQVEILFVESHVFSYWKKSVNGYAT